MADIRNTITYTDNSTLVLNKIAKQMNTIKSQVEGTTVATNNFGNSINALSTSGVAGLHSTLGQVNSDFLRIQSSVTPIQTGTERINSSFAKGRNLIKSWVNGIRNFGNLVPPVTSKFTYMSSVISGIKGQLGGILGLMGIMQGIRIGFKATDTYASANARLNQINDGLQTSEELQNQIYQSAQRSRASYAETAQFVSKIGLLTDGVFKSTKETVVFAETLNKAFTASGAGVAEQEGATRQLTQALASGVLRGEELNSVMENAPILAQMIAKEMGRPFGMLRELASEGEVTADIVKRAVLNNANELQASFEKIPITFSSAWVMASNYISKSFDTTKDKLIGLLNQPGSQDFINTLKLGIDGFVIAVNFAVSAVQFLINNFAIIRPLLVSLTAVWIAQTTAMLISTGVKIANTVATFTNTVANQGLMVAIQGTTIAQTGLNAVLLANPIGLVVLAIIGIVGAFYGLIAIINKTMGTSISATGVIVGAFYYLGASIYNAMALISNTVMSNLLIVWNGFASLANFVGNVFTRPADAVKRLFLDLFDRVSMMMINIARLMDKVLKTDVGGAIQRIKDNLETNIKVSSDYKEFVQMKTLDNVTMDYKDPVEAYGKGYDIGKGFSNIFGDFGKSLTGGAGEGLAIDTSTDPTLKAIEDNTKKTAESSESMTEVLQYMRDANEQSAINRYTTRNIKIEMTNNNSINNDVDVDDMIYTLKQKLEEEIDISPEGVFA